MRTNWWVACTLALTAQPAFAYTIQSSATTGCHELLTGGAWRQAQQAFPELTAPLPSRGDDEPLIADLPFDVPKSLQSIGPVTLLLGVRDNDIKHHGPQDLTELPLAASDPKAQQEHCLRAPDQDEPNGSQDAVEECRNFIRENLHAALDGLDSEGRPNAANREKLDVSLAIRGEIEVSVPKFFLRAGRAMHAIQDSFTHTFRRPDDLGKITVVLNFVDYTAGTIDPAVDGPEHASELDECEDLDELRTERHAMAAEACSVALTALLDPALDRSGKELAIDAMLDNYVSFDETAHCTADNAWCDAPERSYGSPTLGCHLAGSSSGGGSGMALILAGAGVLGLRRRRWASLLTAVGVSGMALPARADIDDPEHGPIDGPAAALAGDSGAAVKGKTDKAGAFFARLAIGGSYDRSAFSGGAGLRYQLSSKWMLGFDGEWNPYVAFASKKVHSGSANAYLSLIRRYQLTYAPVNMRTTASVGGSMLLFDLVGADKYSFGPYLGVSFIGVEWKAARGFYLTVDPTYIAIPIPSVTGVPFAYVQYRFLVGIEFGG